MKIINDLKKTILEIRKSRESKFLFIPEIITLSNALKIIYLESKDTQKSDFLLINLVLEELKKDMIIKSSGVEYSKYNLGNIKVHDVFLTTVDNTSSYRGTSTDYSEAFGKAIGELLERISMRYMSLKVDTLEISIKEMIDRKLVFYNPLDFPQATSEQKTKYPNMDISLEDKFKWVKVNSLNQNNQIYIPAQTVYFDSNIIGEKDMIQMTTHGLGAGYDSHKAFNSGLLEIIHRHFFLKDWYRSQIAVKIDCDSILDSISPDHSLYKLIDNLKKTRFNIYIFDYTEKAGVYTQICLLEKYGGFYCGGSSCINLNSSIEKSIMEAFSTYLWECKATLNGENNVTLEMIGIAQSKDLHSHDSSFYRVMFFANSDFAKSNKMLQQMIGSKNYITYSELREKINALDVKSHFSGVFKDIFYLESDFEYIKKYNFKVTKVIIPQTFFFALDDRYARPILKGEPEPINTKINPFP